MGAYEYDLLLRPDPGGCRRTQWFYFGISGMTSGLPYKLNIINFEKRETAFNAGMRPCFFSLKEFQAFGLGWRRLAELDQIVYFPTLLPLKSEPDGPVPDPNSAAAKGRAGQRTAGDPSVFWTLSLTMRFAHDHDHCFLAHSYPYTLSMLRSYLNKKSASLQQAARVRFPANRPPPSALDLAARTPMLRQPLCYSRAGNTVELLTISDFTGGATPMRLRPVVVLSARVHPSEPAASWCMEGVVDFLTGDSNEAKALRSRLVFKLVPMLNPDGVVLGYTRCNLSGVDLNRVWTAPDPMLHPSIVSIKALVRHLAGSRELLIFCDFHGHSVIPGFALYGCDEDQDPLINNPTASSPATSTAGLPSLDNSALRARTGSGNEGVEVDSREGVDCLPDAYWFPALLSARATHLLDPSRCTFHIHPSKAKSARVVLWRELFPKLPHCFTLEASFFGSDTGPQAGLHFTVIQYLHFGQMFLMAVQDLAVLTEKAVKNRTRA